MAKKEKEVKQAILGRKGLEPKKKYKLDLGTRSQLKAPGTSVSVIKEELTGKEIEAFCKMNGVNVDTLGLN
jgi:hypothetical protein